ncbi:tetratricopeptide repeat protein [Yinghuangia seranimata]|uniref:tetratricopeptide repeat protein n=1 Tax=Yinghuangia seranimata TaxID=408067 RepID=UPI00248CC38C|nr:tetratricopeptide repeat protein [Yinghuangia seranimata]MDI2131176.1 tetratricopeptide repeat protein [Yinghuangia seranimata]
MATTRASARAEVWRRYGVLGAGMLTAVVIGVRSGAGVLSPVLYWWVGVAPIARLVGSAWQVFVAPLFGLRLAVLSFGKGPLSSARLVRGRLVVRRQHRGRPSLARVPRPGRAVGLRLWLATASVLVVYVSAAALLAILLPPYCGRPAGCGLATTLLLSLVDVGPDSPTRVLLHPPSARQAVERGMAVDDDWLRLAHLFAVGDLEAARQSLASLPPHPVYSPNATAGLALDEGRYAEAADVASAWPDAPEGPFRAMLAADFVRAWCYGREAALFGRHFAAPLTGPAGREPEGVPDDVEAAAAAALAVPGATASSDVLAQYRLIRGDHAEAVTAANEAAGATTSLPESAHVHCTLAHAYLALGERAKAAEELATAQQLAPGAPRIAVIAPWTAPPHLGPHPVSEPTLETS